MAVIKKTLFEETLSVRPEPVEGPNRFLKKPDCTSLQALTAAALILPGLLHAPAHAAEDDSVDFQYSHYQEGRRAIYATEDFDGTGTFNTFKIRSNLKPIEVDSLRGGARITLTDRVKFAFNYTQDTWGGATPVATAPVASGGANRVVRDQNNVIVGASPQVPEIGSILIDGQGNLFVPNIDINTGALIPTKDNRLTHVLAAASPETRKQGDFKLGYEWDEAAVNVGGGISTENDYESRFGNLGLRLDFNQKQTTLNLGLSYTNSDTHATIDPDGLQFISTTSYEALNTDGTNYIPIPDALAHIDSTYKKIIAEDGTVSDGARTGAVLRGNRQDWGTQLDLTQVLNKNALLELGMGYTRSTGYMANPYKVVQVFDLIGTAEEISGSGLHLYSATKGDAPIEKRPGERNQYNWHLGYNQYIEPLDAAMYFNYRFAHDDWGINAHTFEADWVQPVGSGWTVTPNIRYYSQSSAFFYTPFLTTIVELAPIDPNTGEPAGPDKIIKALPDNYSSDQRLSGFGALSGGITVAKQFGKGIQLQTGFEYYTHQGGLKLGSGGEADFANFDYWVANAALKLDLGAVNYTGGSGGHDDHHHAHANTPAGVMFAHTLAQAGDLMVGYRYMRSEQAGNMLLGTQAVGLDSVQLNGCVDKECAASPKHMAMNMHMLDLMYAPTDWLSLMLMPQWVDMDMTMTHLSDPALTQGHSHGGATNGHQTGGVGDTGLYALLKLLDTSDHHVNLSLGGTAPTGDVGITLRNTAINPSDQVFIHYGMQLGSGTWDFKPSLTYTGEVDKFNWGAQATGTKRLESRNSSNFAFGDNFQSSVWGGYAWLPWLSSTVRGVYTWQNAISGAYTPATTSNRGNAFDFKHVGPFDNPANYGGRFVDLGLGVNVTVPSGTFAGNTLKFEWLQPVHTDYNGYQLDRDYSLAVNWSYGF